MSEEAAELKNKIKSALKEEEIQELDEEEVEEALVEVMEDVEIKPKKSKRSREQEQEDEEPTKPKTAKKSRVEKSEESQEHLVFHPERKRSASELRQIDEEIDRRFVNLVDILPPIPQKGQFNIELTRDSTYFFS